MKCMQPSVVLPVDFEGEHLGIMVSELEGKVWVCIDGQSVLRARRLTSIEINAPVDDLLNLSESQEFFLKALYQFGPLYCPETIEKEELEALKKSGYVTDTTVGGTTGYMAVTGKGIAHYQRYLAG